MSPTTAAMPAALLDDLEESWLMGRPDAFYSDYYEAE